MKNYNTNSVEEMGTLENLLSSGLNKADKADKKNFGADCKYIGNDASCFSGTDFKSKKEAAEMFRSVKADLKMNGKIRVKE